MDKIYGTNLGNWLVLEKWMQPMIFDAAGVEDEISFYRKLPQEEYEPIIKQHRDTYVTEDDFALIASHGMNTVRIPVPYFIFGDCKVPGQMKEGYTITERDRFHLAPARAQKLGVKRMPGCVDYLDKAFEWAEKYGLKILIDLHTVPGSQNGYDNGGLTGVCKWYKDREGVDHALSVLERLAERYGSREGLFGIEVVNEPISFLVWITSPSLTKAEDKTEARGSWYVPMSFLTKYYTKAYQRIRKHMPEDKAVVFHDGFRLTAWNSFFDQSGMKNVYLDTHTYIFAMESFVPIHNPLSYKAYLAINKSQLQQVNRHIPVITGEWCLSNQYAVNCPDPEEKARRFREIAKLQTDIWNLGAGSFYWNYQLMRDKDTPPDAPWKESWDLSYCWRKEYI